MNRIKELREQKSLTQTELGKILDVEKSTVSKYENGSLDLSSNTISQLCDYFQVSADYLLGRSQHHGNRKDDEEIEEIINTIHKNPDTKILFQRSAKLSKKELNKILKIIEVMHEEES
ncbi:MAG: helix-turn-helix domain-containing protein [Bacillota bacterium]|jgi:transcriptional regulator with XRE-family HTH domain